MDCNGPTDCRQQPSGASPHGGGLTLVRPHLGGTAASAVVHDGKSADLTDDDEQLRAQHVPGVHVPGVHVPEAAAGSSGPAGNASAVGCAVGGQPSLAGTAWSQCKQAAGGALTVTVVLPSLVALHVPVGCWAAGVVGVAACKKVLGGWHS